jgi:hypothetical protein
MQSTRLKNGENLALFSVFGKLSEWLRRRFASFAWRKTVLSAHRRDGHGAKCRCLLCDNLFSRNALVRHFFHEVHGFMVQRRFVRDFTAISIKVSKPHDLQL